MSKYKCIRCLKCFPIKSRLLRHLNGKKICKVADQGQDVDRSKIINDLKTQSKKAKKIKKHINKNFNCDKCTRSFINSFQLNRHKKYCYGPDICIWNMNLRFKKENRKFNRLDSMILNLIKDTYLTPIQLIKIKSNGTYEIYEKGNWITIGKFQLMEGLLRKIAEFPAFTNKVKLILTDMADTITDQYVLNEWENKKSDICQHKRYRFLYKTIFEGLCNGISDPDNILSYSQTMKKREADIIEAEIENQENVNEEKQQLENKKIKALNNWKDNELPQMLKQLINDLHDEYNWKYAVEEIAHLSFDQQEEIFKSIEEDDILRHQLPEIVSEVQNFY